MGLELTKMMWWNSDDADDVSVVELDPTVGNELKRECEIPTLLDLFVWACNGFGVRPFIPPKIQMVYDSEKGEQFIVIYPDRPNIPFAVNEEVYYDGEDDDEFDEDAYDDCHLYRDMRYLELWRIKETITKHLKETKTTST